MTAMPPLRDILNNTPANAIDVDFDFNTIEAHITNELINRDGSVAMTAPLTLSGPPTAPQHAASKQYVDTSTPIGMVQMFAGGPGVGAGGSVTIPAGWALCDGSSKSTTDPLFVALFAVIGYSYGGSLGNFNLPNLGGRVPVGRAAGDALFGTLGQATGNRDATGVPTHTHGLNHAHTASSGLGSPDHAHTFSTGIDSPDHTHDTRVRTGFNMNSANAPGATNAVYPPSTPLVFDTRPSALTVDVSDGPNHQQSGGVAVNHTHSGTTGGITANHNHAVTVDPQNGQSQGPSGGGAVANANVQPSIAINYIIRTG